MLIDLSAEEADAPGPVSTGQLLAPEDVRRLVQEAHVRYAGLGDGRVADYIPALARVAPELFGIAVVGVSGNVYEAGDAHCAFTIQSISKPFVFALVCQEIGYLAAREKLGVNATGLPFNSVMAIELNRDRTMNPMVNAGAIATTSLVPGNSPAAKWQFVQDGLSRFAGRRLSLDVEVYESEAATNQRNQGIARLL